MEAPIAFIVNVMYIVFLHCTIVESFMTEWRVWLLISTKISLSASVETKILI